MSFYTTYEFKTKSGIINELKNMKKEESEKIIDKNLEYIVKEQLKDVDEKLIIQFKEAIENNDKDKISSTVNEIYYYDGKEKISILQHYIEILIVKCEILGDLKERDKLWQLYYAI